MSSENEENVQEVTEWVRFGMRMAVSAAMHPLEYSKTLMQLGYEPIPPVPGRTLLGRPILVLPNIFQYAGHIRKVDGFYGCYRGFTPNLVGCICSMMLSERVATRLGLEPVEDRKDDINISDTELYVQFKVNLKRDVVISATGVLVSHPFHVISVRMMAQFIGREDVYTSILGSIVEVYKNDGILGFFAGLVPRMLCDLACVVLTSSTVYLLSKYLIKDKIGRQYSAVCVQFGISSILYPLNVISTCMIVTGSRLMAGQPPMMPEYKSWLDCFADLSTRGELCRGSQKFFRNAGGATKKFSARNTIYAPLPILAKYQ